MDKRRQYGGRDPDDQVADEGRERRAEISGNSRERLRESPRGGGRSLEKGLLLHQRETDQPNKTQNTTGLQNAHLVLDYYHVGVSQYSRGCGGTRGSAALAGLVRSGFNALLLLLLFLLLLFLFLLLLLLLLLFLLLYCCCCCHRPLTLEINP